MIKQYFEQIIKAIEGIDREDVNAILLGLYKLREDRGRLFIIGVGGGAGNASHAVNDFRKLCGIEAYCPLDNISELTARINDDGWENALVGSLEASNLNGNDAVMVFSVGGGNVAKNVSMNLVRALQYATEVGASIFGIVGRDGGYTKKVADACVIIPTINEGLVTPITESLQAVIWHTLVFHPTLKVKEGKWEGLK